MKIKRMTLKPEARRFFKRMKFWKRPYVLNMDIGGPVDIAYHGEIVMRGEVVRMVVNSNGSAVIEVNRLDHRAGWRR